MDNTIVGYTAGIIDGEGCITISFQKYSVKRNRSRHRLTVDVANTNRVLLEWLQKNWGGHIYESKPQKIIHKIGYHWKLQGINTIELLRAVLPYLILKKEQALLALAFLRTMWGCHGTQSLPLDIIQERFSIEAKMKLLNRKGALPFAS